MSNAGDTAGVFPRGLVQNDPDFTLLCIGEKGFGDNVCLQTDSDWIRLGKLVGESSHLTILELEISSTYTERKESYEEMLRGVRKNRSLNTLRVIGDELVLGFICSILAPFLEGDKRLTKFIFSTVSATIDYWY